ncbi:sensor histidine kinase [Nesterenkonia sandarakina]|uniref:histidine kinase n=1 Tax=Nesterenkonia sandarakina TaxID=272918 RepID=A0A2T0YDN2_9MICC|nr:sensor histidine kinase [Nesterenkonia sandarakina]PRZ12940.1 signal transduction histidine kinase [Nesterenkonia sandarakina]
MYRPASGVEKLQGALLERPKVIDACLAVGLFLVLGMIIQAEQGGIRAPDALAYLFALALGMSLFWRRRFPLSVLFFSVVVLMLYNASGYPNIGLGLPLAAALYSVAKQDRPRWSLKIAGGLVFLFFAAAVVAPFVRQTDENVFSLFVYTLAPEVALMAAVIALGDGARSRREASLRSARLLEATAEQERTLAQAIAASERAEIARELHDTLGHQTTVISMHTEVATEALPGNPAAAQGALGIISSTSGEMIAELRATVRKLREHEVRRPVVSIAALEKSVFADSALTIEADITVTRQFGEEVEAVVYRIVQEALTNVAKHSAARTVYVQIRERGKDLEVTVRDNGPHGSLGDTHAGVGLVGMKERAAAVGGSIETGPWGEGFRVRALLPIEPAQPQRFEKASA